jgi:transposase
MNSPRYSPEFKDESVGRVREQGLALSQAARDLDIPENVLRKWVNQYQTDPAHAFPGAGQMRPEQAEVAELKREVRILEAERDILKKAVAYFAMLSK